MAPFRLIDLSRLSRFCDDTVLSQKKWIGNFHQVAVVFCGNLRWDPIEFEQIYFALSYNVFFTKHSLPGMAMLTLKCQFSNFWSNYVLLFLFSICFFSSLVACFKFVPWNEKTLPCFWDGGCSQKAPGGELKFCFFHFTSIWWKHTLRR